MRAIWRSLAVLPAIGLPSALGNAAVRNLGHLLWVLPSLALAGAAVLWNPARTQGYQGERTASLGNAELQAAAEQGEMCSARNKAGSGLQAEYFARPSLEGKQLVQRIDPTVEFDMASDWQGMPANPRSVRWTGWVKAPVTGRYRFHGTAPITSVKVSQMAVFGTGAAPDATTELSAGRYFPIAVEVSDLSIYPIERVRLEWTLPYGARMTIPKALLFPPTPQVATKPTQTTSEE